jgi:FkbM family methyltransferase
LGKNELYDRYTKKIIFKHCKQDSNCIDIGANEGKILQWMIETAPNGNHIAFEPIPSLLAKLKLQFGSKALILPIALSDKRGISPFNYVINNPALSGLLKRPYPNHYQEKQIEVTTELLDYIIEANQKISLIKMDVEGGEWNVLQGAIKTIHRTQPLILFECGKIGGDLYKFSDINMFQLFNNILKYRIFTLKGWLESATPLTSSDFSKYYENGSEYFFVAAPIDNTLEIT